MAEFLEDPSVLTKDKLKSELAANNVPLPSGEHKKEVYVQLYLKNLTALNHKKSPPADTFSSDEELPAPVVSNKSRSGRVSSYIDSCEWVSLSVAVFVRVVERSLKFGGLTSFIYAWNDLFVWSQKATKKTDKPRSEEVEVTDLTDEDLKEQLAKRGVETGPIVGESACVVVCVAWRG